MPLYARRGRIGKPNADLQQKEIDKMRARNSWESEAISSDVAEHNARVARLGREVISEWNASVENPKRSKAAIQQIKDEGFTWQPGLFSRINGGIVADADACDRG